MIEKYLDFIRGESKAWTTNKTLTVKLLSRFCLVIKVLAIKKI